MIDWQRFLPASFLMAMIPGANQLLGLRNAALVGVRHALIGIVGRFTAFALLVSMVVVGLGTVLTQSAVAFEVLRWLGVGYLIWLGGTALWNAGKGGRYVTGEADVRLVVAARQELVTALTNPKALLLFVSFLPQFLSASAPPSSLISLAAAYIGIEWLAAMVYIAVGRALRHEENRLRVSRRRLDQVAGIGFLGFGGYLVFAQRP
ncbi:LysE family translocator [Amycolatopsis taiwanensis]|uniref:Lysine transporter LysE n=1 Tax=Amycolatopsis taiwanensis TaxID=342230 RepID=A0A9W6R1G4_9PSEU|nr:LysE family translocator [Amycolatopsis taiwanensis]GLY65800.1 lysine transporter LysE [Amycolatopsis taiwanensis]